MASNNEEIISSQPPVPVTEIERNIIARLKAEHVWIIRDTSKGMRIHRVG